MRTPIIDQAMSRGQRNGLFVFASYNLMFFQQFYSRPLFVDEVVWRRRIIIIIRRVFIFIIVPRPRTTPPVHVHDTLYVR